jgi:Xaa-Pro aminopeptidase
MDPDLSELDAALEEAGADGYLVDADGTDADQRYLSGFAAPDPFVTCYDGSVNLLVSSLEYGRARKDARAATVARYADYDYHERVAERGPREARLDVVEAFLDDCGVDAVLAPERFPLGTGDGLRDRGVDLDVETTDAVERVRATKTEAERGHVARAQRANEAAMAAAEDLLAGADVADGTLVFEGDPLTSERVKEEIEVTLLRHGCALDETIVACGADAADPHDRGSGPIAADQPVIVDIFPRDKETRYHADMTRTFVKGEPADRLREWFELTDEARRAAVDAVEPGVTGEAVHAAACEVYEDAGLPTLRTDPGAETGYIHGTGHGVGLDVHELPRLAPGGDELQAGNVVTVEPGLYDPAVGGVRIEDLVVVTEDGHENLTDYPVDLVV